MIRFWVDKGVGGFRLDVIDHIAKVPLDRITKNGPRLHEFVRELSKEAFIEPGLVTVGEAWGADMDQAKLYSAADASELSMVFQFDHICVDRDGDGPWGSRPFSLPRLKRVMERWQRELYGQGWNSLFLDNHDLPRIVSRWGDEGEYRVESAKMLATMLHGMAGTPYIYQGEELGMTNPPLTLDQFVDVGALNDYQAHLDAGDSPEQALAYLHAWARDNARTPMQWTSGKNAGFSTAEKTWMPVNPNHTEINAEAALADPGSVFYHYQKLIALRKRMPIFRDGTFTLLEPDSEELFAYTRDTAKEHLLVVCNFTDRTVPWQRPAAFAQAELLLSNYDAPGDDLRPYEAQIFYRRDKNAN